jgi:hypothetical protein
MAITTHYNDGVFEARDGDQILVYQPFKPTATGEQPAWANQEEADAWWESVKHLHGVPVETPPSE